MRRSMCGRRDAIRLTSNTWLFTSLHMARSTHPSLLSKPATDALELQGCTFSTTPCSLSFARSGTTRPLFLDCEWYGAAPLDTSRFDSHLASQDHCEMMPALDAQSILPQYFPLKHFPNYAPGAAAPLLKTPDIVWHYASQNPAVCRGISPLENCMLDLFSTPVHPKPLPL